MTENSADVAQNGKVTCPCGVRFRSMRFITELYQVPGACVLELFSRLALIGTIGTINTPRKEPAEGAK